METVVPDRFKLTHDLYYLDRQRTTHHIPAHPWAFGKPMDPTKPQGCDLASIPWPLWSLIGSYGRHTLPAIAHDYWCEQSNAQNDEDIPGALRARLAGDRRFRDALGDCNVSAVRTWVLWTGVCFGTYGKYRKLSCVLLGILAAAPLLYAVWKPALAVLLWIVSLLPAIDVDAPDIPHPGWTIAAVLVAGPPAIGTLACLVTGILRKKRPDLLGMPARSVGALVTCGGYSAYLAAPVFVVGGGCGVLLFAAAVVVHWVLSRTGQESHQPRFQPTIGEHRRD